MSRYKHYLDISVVEAARQRTAHIFDVFDSVAVMFSGGKDSLVCLELALAEARRRGQLPLDVVFRDEELIPDSVIDFVDGYRRRPEVRMHWFAVPMLGSKKILSEVTEIVFWQPGRKWVRERPPWAITDAGPQVASQTNMDAMVCRTAGFKGRVGYITGVRADESMWRYRSVVNKLNENYICASSCPQVRLCKPIYDWSENDIFKWLRQENIPWCEFYEARLMGGGAMRVSTPLHAESASQLPQLKAIDPEFYDRLQAAYPEANLHARYCHELAPQRDTFDGDMDDINSCFAFVAAMKDVAKKAQAEKVLASYATLHENNPESYPPRQLLRAFLNGVVHRLPLPNRKGASA